MRPSYFLTVLLLFVSLSITACAGVPASVSSEAAKQSADGRTSEKAETYETRESLDNSETNGDGKLSGSTEAPKSTLDTTAEKEEAEESAEELTEAEEIAAFALKIKSAVADSDIETLAELCGYPVYVSMESGDGQEIKNKKELLAIGSDHLFTDKTKAIIAAADESRLETYGAGILLGDNGTIVFNSIDGSLMITGINLSD